MARLSQGEFDDAVGGALVCPLVGHQHGDAVGSSATPKFKNCPSLRDRLRRGQHRKHATNTANEEPEGKEPFEALQRHGLEKLLLADGGHQGREGCLAIEGQHRQLRLLEPDG